MSEPRTPQLNPLFQVGIDVQGKPCLVVGGEAEALDKTRRLLTAGADVTVVSDAPCQELIDLARAGALRLRQRQPRRSDLRGVVLVINTLPRGRAVNVSIWRWARRRRIALNSFDQPELSDFGMPALVAAGHLRIAISTSNASPSLSGRLRRDLEQLFGPEAVAYLESLARTRIAVRQGVPDPDTRVAILRGLIEGFHLSGSLQLPRDWRRRLEDARRQADSYDT